MFVVIVWFAIPIVVLFFAVSTYSGDQAKAQIKGPLLTPAFVRLRLRPGDPTLLASHKMFF
jgi:hypothetical protein